MLLMLLKVFYNTIRIFNFDFNFNFNLVVPKFSHGGRKQHHIKIKKRSKRCKQCHIKTKRNKVM